MPRAMATGFATVRPVRLSRAAHDERKSGLMGTMTKRQACLPLRNAAAPAGVQEHGRPHWASAFVRVMRLSDGTAGIGDMNGGAFLAGDDT